MVCSQWVPPMSGFRLEVFRQLENLSSATSIAIHVFYHLRVDLSGGNLPKCCVWGWLLFDSGHKLNVSVGAYGARVSDWLGRPLCELKGNSQVNAYVAKFWPPYFKGDSRPSFVRSFLISFFIPKSMMAFSTRSRK